MLGSRALISPVVGRYSSQTSTIMTINTHLLPADVSLEEEENSNFDFRRFYLRVLGKSFKAIKPSRSLAEEQDRPFS